MVCRRSLKCPCPRGVLGLSLVPKVSLVCHLSPRCPWTIICPRGVPGVLFVPKVSLDYCLPPRCPWTIIYPQRVLGLSFIPNVSWDYHLSPRCPGTIIYPQRVLGLSFIPNVSLRRRLMVGCVFGRCRKNTMSLPRPADQPQPRVGRVSKRGTCCFVHFTRCPDFVLPWDFC